jgi:hypothetical protein
MIRPMFVIDFNILLQVLGPNLAKRFFQDDHLQRIQSFWIMIMTVKLSGSLRKKAKTLKVVMMTMKM